MNRLVLHFGTEGTEASALREFLSGNRERLSQLGVHCPDPGAPRQAALAAALHKGDPKPILDLLASPEAGRHAVVVLSSEAFLSYASAVRAVREAVPSVTVAVYLRRQDHAVESGYQRSVSGEPRSTKTFAQYLSGLGAPGSKEQRGRLDWHALLGDLAAAFGRENLVVRPFEPGQLTGGTIYADFLAVLGLALDATFTVPTAGQSGSRLSPQITELQRIVNGLRGWPQQEQLERLLREGAQQGAAAPAAGADYLSPPQRMALLEQFAESNARIAREYLQREDGQLFQEPLPDPGAPWHEPAFDFQQLVPPLVGLIALLHHETLELSRLLSSAEQRLKSLRKTSRHLPASILNLRSLPSPLSLWRWRRDTNILRKSELFDAAYYTATYPDVVEAGTDPIAHYVRYGWLEGRNPSARFNTRRYLDNHPDVAAARRCPLVILALRTKSDDR